MRQYAIMAVILLFVPGQVARAQHRDSGADSQAVRLMPMMWMHLDSTGQWTPGQMHLMMPAHQRMAAQMMTMMGSGGMMGNGMMGHGMGATYWTALRDSVNRDLSVLPDLSGRDLSSRMLAHADRFRRLMALQMGMTGGGGWEGIPGGCSTLDSLGYWSPQHMQGIWGMHTRISTQMIDAMVANMQAVGSTPGRSWLALRDSVRADLAALPGLQGDALRARILAHADRMYRLVGMQVSGVGMHIGPMHMDMSCPQ